MATTPTHGTSSDGRMAPLDEVDRRIVAALRADGRMSMRALASALQTGCPHPLALTPGICSACEVMSYTMLSLRVPSGLTPAGT